MSRNVVTKALLPLLMAAAACLTCWASAAENEPAAEVKPLFDLINRLRTDPAANANVAHDLTKQAFGPNYRTDGFFVNDRPKALASFDELADHLKARAKTAPLTWDPGLAEIAAREGKSRNRLFKPEFYEVEGADKPEYIVMWWMVNVSPDVVYRLLDPRLQRIGIARVAGGDAGSFDYRVVASKLPGEAFTMTDADLAGRPYDARLDKDNNIHTLEPKLAPFVHTDGSLDVAWKDLGPEPHVFVSRFSPAGNRTMHVEVGAAEAATYPVLAGFTEDPDGNLYVLKAKDEGDLTFKQDPATPKDGDGNPVAGYDRPEVMKLYKLDGDGNELWSRNLLKRGGGAHATFNPLGSNGKGGFGGTARLAFVRMAADQPGVIFAIYGSNTDYDFKISARHQQAYWRAVRADNGAPLLGKNGWAMGHQADIQVLPSDEGVITVERSDIGIVAANYLRQPQERGHKPYVFEHAWFNNNCFTELGSLAAAADGYAVLIASNRSPAEPVSISGNNQRFNEERARSRDLAIIRWKKGFTDDLDRVRQGGEYRSFDDPGRAKLPEGIITRPATYFTDYGQEGKFDAERPRMVRTGENEYVVVWERWTRIIDRSGARITVYGNYDSTWTAKIDGDGNVLKPPVQMAGAPRITRGDPAFLFQGKCAWITGDAVEKKLLLYTVDADLNSAVTDLRLSVATAAGTFTGEWASTFGPLTLKQVGTRVTGTYPDLNGTLEGTVTGKVLRFQWKEGESGKGSGRFILSDDGNSFTGFWDYGDKPDEAANGWDGKKK
jgi:hypothetical protein